MDIINKIKSQLELIEEARQLAIKNVRPDFFPLVKELFDNYTSVEKVSWTQYTAHWNDGEECEFKTHFDYSIKINLIGEINDEEDIDRNWRIEEFLELNDKVGLDLYLELNTDINYNKYIIARKLRGILESYDDEFYLGLFGDHALVVIHSNGTIEVERYEHD